MINHTENLKRIFTVLISLTAVLSLTSCSAVSVISEKVEDVCSAIYGFVMEAGPEETDAADEELLHDYTAEPYEFKSLDGRFHSVENNEYVCYNNLSDKQKRVYDAMIYAAQRMDKGYFSVGKCSEDDIAIAFQAVSDDNPQLIWLPWSYGFSKYKGEYYITFDDPEGRYGYTFDSESERNEALDKIYEIVDGFIGSNISADMTEFEIELAVHDWICDTVEYDKSAVAAEGTDKLSDYLSSWTVYGALAEHTAVCTGYSYSFQFILKYLGINCISVRANTDKELHMINAAEIDGAWSYVDVTWDDKQLCGLKCAHDFFNLSYGEISATHDVFDGWKTLVDSGTEINNNFNIILPDCEKSGQSYYRYIGTEINDESSFRTVLTGYFADGDSDVAEFRITFTEVTADKISHYCDRYRIIRELSRYVGGIKDIEYAVINNGVFVIKLNRKQRLTK